MVYFSFINIIAVNLKLNSVVCCLHLIAFVKTTTYGGRNHDFVELTTIAGWRNGV